MNRKFSTVRQALRSIRTKLRRSRGVHPADGPITKIIAIATVKNEQDIIEPFLRHNRRFVDAILVLDHMSSDRTREIVLDCARELGGIFLADLPVFAHDHALFMTNALYRMQSAFFADYVCFLDADEFIECENLKKFNLILDSIPSGKCAELPWITYLPEPVGVSATDPLQNMNCRRRREHPPEAKSLLRYGGQLDPYLKVGRGNHFLWNVSGEKVERIPVSGVALKHFPVRSIDQIRIKGIVGWLANLARNPKAGKDGSAWQKRKLFDTFISGRVKVDKEFLFMEAMTYAQNNAGAELLSNYVVAPHNIEITRKYSDGGGGDPVHLVASAWVSSMESQRSLKGRAGKSVSDQLNEIVHSQGRVIKSIGNCLDVSPIAYFSELTRPKAVLDLGCGDGSTIWLIKAKIGARILGVDVTNVNRTCLSVDEFMRVDLRNPIRVGCKFDAVICLNFIDILHSTDHNIVFDNIADHAEINIVVSMHKASQTDQNISVSSMLDSFYSRGWEPDTSLTLGLRALSSTAHLNRGLVVFKKIDGEADYDPSALIRIESYPFRWTRETPGVHEASMLHPLPKASSGYGTRLLSY